MQKARICLHRNGELLKELALPEGWLKDYLTKLSGDITQMANQIPVSDEKWSNDTRAKLQTLDIRGIQQLVESYSRYSRMSQGGMMISEAGLRVG